MSHSSRGVRRLTIGRWIFILGMLAFCVFMAWHTWTVADLKFQVQDVSLSLDTSRQREKKLKFSYMEQKEWETIEDDIAALEEAIADLEQQMQDSARDYTALNGIIKEKEEKEALLEEKMDRWMYLNDLAEKIEAQAVAHK